MRECPGIRVEARDEIGWSHGHMMDHCPGCSSSQGDREALRLMTQAVRSIVGQEGITEGAHGSCRCEYCNQARSLITTGGA